MNFYKIMLLQINFGSSKTQLKFHCGAQKENTGIKAFVFNFSNVNFSMLTFQMSIKLIHAQLLLIHNPCTPFQVKVYNRL